MVPKPGSPTVTQEHLPESEFTALRSVGLRWVTQGHEICSLKIRVSVVRLIRIAFGRSSPFGRLRRLSSLCELIRPWPPSNSKTYGNLSGCRFSLCVQSL